MANGKIRFGKQSGGQLALVIPDGVSNTEVIVPESGELATKQYVDDAIVELKTIATGTATFTATTNNINLTGIGIGIEIGDVIQISGAEDVKNNSEFTVEVITDANNIIVNQAHANKGTTKNLATRASDTDVTVKLLAKWYNASDSLGRDWVDVTTSRIAGTTYSNNTNRSFDITVTATATTNSAFSISTKSVTKVTSQGSGSIPTPRSITISIPVGTYMIETTSTTILSVYELR